VYTNILLYNRNICSSFQMNICDIRIINYFLVGSCEFANNQLGPLLYSVFKMYDMFKSIDALSVSHVYCVSSALSVRSVLISVLWGMFAMCVVCRSSVMRVSVWVVSCESWSLYMLCVSSVWVVSCLSGQLYTLCVSLWVVCCVSVVSSSAGQWLCHVSYVLCACTVLSCVSV
jgi:hypothetical protein